MAKTIHAALAPLLMTGAVCCLCVFEYPVGRPRPYFTCLYFLIVWGSYEYTSYYIVYVIFEEHFQLALDDIIMGITYISMIVSLFRFKELKTCLRAIAIADDTLETLGTPKEYQRLYRWIVGVVLAWIVTTILLALLDIVWQYMQIATFTILDLYIICALLMVNIPVYINNLNGLILGTILGYVGSRFARLNKHVCDLVKKDSKLTGKRHTLILIGRKRVVETKECERRLWILMHLHLHLSRVSRQLNKVYGVQIVLEMGTLFVTLVCLFLNFYFYVSDNNKSIYQFMAHLPNFVWIGVFTIKFIMLNHICQTVSDKANETIEILLKLLNDDLDESLHEQILQFTLQIRQREVKLSGMGFFYVGHKFICNFLMSMLEVLVIIIQFNGFDTDDILIDTSNTDYNHYTDYINDTDPPISNNY